MPLASPRAESKQAKYQEITSLLISVCYHEREPRNWRERRFSQPSQLCEVSQDRIQASARNATSRTWHLRFRSLWVALKEILSGVCLNGMSDVITVRWAYKSSKMLQSRDGLRSRRQAKLHSKSRSLDV